MCHTFKREKKTKKKTKKKTQKWEEVATITPKKMPS